MRDKHINMARHGLCFLLVLACSVSVLSSDAAATRKAVEHRSKAKPPARSAHHPIHARPAAIQYFDARPHGAEVELVWCCFSDKDTRGFRVYRRDQSSSYFSLVNREGLLQPWRQNYLDTDVASASGYQYVLAVVYADGTEFLSQPIEVRTPSRSFVSR